MRSILFLTLIAEAICALAQDSPAAADVAAVARCAALRGIDFSDVQDAPFRLADAAPVEAAGGIPAYCRAQGSVTAQLEFEVRLPLSGWNEKFLAVANASTGDECNTYLKRGYTCMPMFRTGKKGMTDQEMLEIWQRDLKARMDNIPMTHLLALVGKAVAVHYYSGAIRKSYFMGCSSGGYRAMIQAQQFPWDFDGVIAGAPHFDLGEFLLRDAWLVKSFLDRNGQALLNDHALQVLHRAVLAECDRDDGVNDGIVSNPVGCRFNPAKLLCKANEKGQCLTSRQIEAVTRIYAGPKTADGIQISSGVLPGAELGWATALTPKLLEFLRPLFNLAFSDASPRVTLAELDFDREYRRFGLEARYAEPTNPDLRPFHSAGGKLLLYQGTNDITQVGRVIDYYQTVEKVMGGRAPTQEFFRLFMVPGMGHCRGGIGAYAIDYLSYLERWVEQNQAPDFLVGAHIDDAYLKTLQMRQQGLEFPLNRDIPVTFTRPVYPYPSYAKYGGSGNPKDAASFQPVMP